MKYFYLLWSLVISILLLIKPIQTVAETIEFSRTDWPVDIGVPINSSPVLGDLDRDGNIEIVVGADNGYVYAWRPDATLLPGWPVATGDSVRSSPAIKDIDGDAKLDVIVGSFDNKVYAWNFDGVLLPGWPVVTGSVVYSSPAIGDIDGDQKPEIIAGSFDNKMYAWHADGSLVHGWPKSTGLFIYSSPALADIDEDGLLEIISGTDNNRVFAWNGDGTEVYGWPVNTEHVVPSSPAVGDIDNNGILDIVVASWDKMFIWDNRGKRKIGWPVIAKHQIPSSPALTDFNNDGLLEVVVGCKDGNVYMWDSTGQSRPGWPVSTKAEITGSPAIADVDGDGSFDVIIGSKDSYVYVWDAQGNSLSGWPKKTGGAISSSPAIGDIDQNGTLEIVIGSKDGKVYVWTVVATGNTLPRVVWQNFRGDPSHTGRYKKELILASDIQPEPATMMPSPPSVKTPTPTDTISTPPMTPDTPSPAVAPIVRNKKLALLIGNSEYKAAPLSNPVNDVYAMKAALKRLDFEVVAYENLSQREMKQAIDMFGQELTAYNIGLFYYSGHGVQMKGENYLIPIDANPTSENDVEYDCVNAGRILAKMEDAESDVNIIILDACRTNPFEKSWTKSLTGQGLAFMDAPSGSLIAYATAPGNVAFDDPGRANSIYTSALLRYIENPNMTILEVFQKVRGMVMRETENVQTPWESTSLTDNFYFKRE